MGKYLDLGYQYVSVSIQILTGAYFFAKFLQRRVKFYYYILAMIFSAAMVELVPNDRILEFVAYILFLMVIGIGVCRTDGKTDPFSDRKFLGAVELVFLYAALTVEMMQLSYGIVNSLQSIIYPLLASFDRRAVGVVMMLAGEAAAILLSVFCYRMVYRYFLYSETIRKQYMLMILTPILLLFLIGEYINSNMYESMNIMESGIRVSVNRYQIFVIQLLGMASLFCILFAYRKLLQNFRLSTELSLLEQEEHSLSQYVEEAKTRYEETKSFRHDVKNHMTVVRELLQKGKTAQAVKYIGDMEESVEDFSFPCSTNNPVADILVGNKLGLARSMGIDADCSLCLPYPCFVRDIDFGIILSNALDNAIHACGEMEKGVEKYIRVTGRVQGDFVLLEVENSFRGKGFFCKGTGLSNIKKVAEKYQGAMHIKTQGASFLLSVLLIIPRHSESISRQIG